MRSRTSRGVPEWSGGKELYIGSVVSAIGRVSGFTGIVLARDSIVGIPIPCSISLPASLFTRYVTHDPITSSLVTLSSL